MYGGLVAQSIVAGTSKLKLVFCNEFFILGPLNARVGYVLDGGGVWFDRHYCQLDDDKTLSARNGRPYTPDYGTRV